MVHTTKRAFLLSLIIFLLPACATSGSMEFSNINCHVFYRSSSGESLAESPALTLSSDGGSDSISFDDMEFHVQFLVDAFEGNSLSIAVTNIGTQGEITRALYQIDSELGLSNQFIGGHGFTGLAYVFHPQSQAEMQYFCDVG